MSAQRPCTLRRGGEGPEGLRARNNSRRRRGRKDAAATTARPVSRPADAGTVRTYLEKLPPRPGLSHSETAEAGTSAHSCILRPGRHRGGAYARGKQRNSSDRCNSNLLLLDGHTLRTARNCSSEAPKDLKPSRPFQHEREEGEPTVPDAVTTRTSSNTIATMATRSEVAPFAPIDGHVEEAAFPRPAWRLIRSPKLRGRAIKRQAALNWQTSGAASCSNTPHAAVARQRTQRCSSRPAVSTAAVVCVR